LATGREPPRPSVARAATPRPAPTRTTRAARPSRTCRPGRWAPNSTCGAPRWLEAGRLIEAREAPYAGESVPPTHPAGGAGLTHRRAGQAAGPQRWPGPGRGPASGHPDRARGTITARTWHRGERPPKRPGPAARGRRGGRRPRGAGGGQGCASDDRAGDGDSAFTAPHAPSSSP